MRRLFTPSSNPLFSLFSVHSSSSSAASISTSSSSNIASMLRCPSFASARPRLPSARSLLQGPLNPTSPLHSQTARAAAASGLDDRARPTTHPSTSGRPLFHSLPTSHPPKHRHFAAAASGGEPSAAASAPQGVWKEVLPTPVNVQEDQRSLHTVSVALYANTVIFLAKTCVWMLSGSSSMLAEAVHSLVDVANQVFLRMGVLRASRKADLTHPYGFYRDKFIFSLISAVGVLCLGGGISLVHGVQAMFSPSTEHLKYLAEGLVVLAISFFVEGYSLLVAFRAVAEGARAAKMSFWRFVTSGRDPTSIAVLLEDAAAVSGVAVAGACTWLAHTTHNMFFDALGSVLVGSLLAVTALFLIQNNRRLLIGRAMSPVETSRILKHLERDPVVAAVFDAKSEELGPGIYRFKAEIAFSGETVMDRHILRNPAKAALLQNIKDSVSCGDDLSFDHYVRRLGREVTGAIGFEIDRLEQEIRAVVPGVRHVDLEADRGRFFAAYGGAGPSYENSTLSPLVSKASYWEQDGESRPPPSPCSNLDYDRDTPSGGGTPRSPSPKGGPPTPAGSKG